MTSTIQCSIDADRIATVWLNEPGKSVNTLPPEVLAELSTTLAGLEADDTLRGVIFASQKPTTFVAGADLKKVRAMDQATFDQYLIDGQELYDRIERLAVPTVAAINGHCLGGGLELALTCRTRIAADVPTALVGLPETAIGLIPGWGGTVRLPRLIGYPAAVPLLLESRKFSPLEALRLGIVDEVIAPDDLWTRAREVLQSDRQAPRSGENGAKNEKEDALRDDSTPCDVAIEAAVLRTRPVLSPEELSLASVDRLIDVLLAGCRGGPEAGLRAEREAASALFAAAECHERLDRFFSRK